MIRNMMNSSKHSPQTSATVYGISNCDTVKKARAWLTDRGIAVTFHDFKTTGVPAAQLPLWAQLVGWEALVNRKGTTWRKLDEATQFGVVDLASATDLMLSHPSVIKRPVVAWSDGSLTVGFDTALFESHVS